MWQDATALSIAESLWQTRGLELLAWVVATSRASVLSGYVEAALAVGICLVVVWLVMAGFGIASRRAVWVTTTITGAVMMPAAAEGGVGFLVADRHNSDSLLMALGFIGAMLAYGSAFALTGNPTGPHSHSPTDTTGSTGPTKASLSRQRS
jgi:hypothetical protein